MKLFLVFEKFFSFSSDLIQNEGKIELKASKSLMVITGRSTAQLTRHGIDPITRSRQKQMGTIADGTIADVVVVVVVDV